MAKMFQMSKIYSEEYLQAAYQLMDPTQRSLLQTKVLKLIQKTSLENYNISTYPKGKKYYKHG